MWFHASSGLYMVRTPFTVSPTLHHNQRAPAGAQLRHPRAILACIAAFATMAAGHRRCTAGICAQDITSVPVQNKPEYVHTIHSGAVQADQKYYGRPRPQHNLGRGGALPERAPPTKHHIHHLLSNTTCRSSMPACWPSTASGRVVKVQTGGLLQRRATANDGSRRL